MSLETRTSFLSLHNGEFDFNVTIFFQRVKTPKLYDDPNVDDEIEGKITYSVKEKLKDPKFEISSCPEALLEFEGKGMLLLITFSVFQSEQFQTNSPMFA